MNEQPLRMMSPEKLDSTTPFSKSQAGLQRTAIRAATLLANKADDNLVNRASQNLPFVQVDCSRCLRPLLWIR